MYFRHLEKCPPKYYEHHTNIGFQNKKIDTSKNMNSKIVQHKCSTYKHVKNTDRHPEINPRSLNKFVKGIGFPSRDLREMFQK